MTPAALFLTAFLLEPTALTVSGPDDAGRVSVRAQTVEQNFTLVADELVRQALVICLKGQEA